MSDRRRLPGRRGIETITFKLVSSGGVESRYIVSVHYFDGPLATRFDRPAEIFVNTEMKQGSEADVNAADGAVAVSLALQYGCPADVLRGGMKRNEDGTAQGPLGAALDAVCAPIGDRPQDGADVVEFRPPDAPAPATAEAPKEETPA